MYVCMYVCMHACMHAARENCHNSGELFGGNVRSRTSTCNRKFVLDLPETMSTDVCVCEWVCANLLAITVYRLNVNEDRFCRIKDRTPIIRPRPSRGISRLY